MPLSWPDWPASVKTNVFSNIWKDARLLNATVYAQWLCVLSAISFVVIRICWLISADTPPHEGEVLGIPLMIADMIFFPTISLTVELSHILRTRVPAYIGLVYCTLRMFTSFMSSAAEDSTDGIPSGPYLFLGIARVLATYYMLVLPYTPAKTRLDPDPPRAIRNIDSLPVRACFQLACTLALPYFSRPPHGTAAHLFAHVRPPCWRVEALAYYALPSYFEPAFAFTGCAALAYFAALIIGQEYVFSRTLGGPGVERLTFIRPGRVQLVDSIGLEEGRIRLP
ncbi:uncharacterized protein F4807DRAFT_29798 [Annulohypoxylon truncatum]|uniref:uncharacterized protein n=1 Tax=Annulohypoxylon truncatum TaxID=327061 RepID=UPI002008D00A|nr:uncharacterized protein F4807DRAFT_29798 [Annulohypoxylon truncatum]KAI1211255.1 hypothetical protein F4807DRAFT_29798 [Annulohypoxylon truncatum]